MITSSVGGSPTTTYAENIGVMAATRVYSTAAYFVAAVVAILLGFIPKFGAIVAATPGGVLAGITLVLYGMIGLLGAKIWVENRVNFADPVNLVPVAAGLTLAIGLGTTGFFQITDDFSLGGIALGTIVILAGYHVARAIEPRSSRRRRWRSTTPISRSNGRGCGNKGTVKPAPFAYHRPGTVTEAVAALAGDPGAKVLAGGQSLVPLLSMRLAAPSALVDLNGIPGLDSIDVDEAGVRIGALARHADVLASEDVRRVQPLVSLALANVAHATIRNRGTTVGSLVHADAAAEMPVVLTLLGGSLDVEGPAGRRTIPAAELYVGPLESSVHHDEVAVSAFFPALAPGAGVAFEEIARRHGDYALVGAAALVEGESVKVGYLSVSDVPTVVDLSGVADDDLGDAALEHLEPGDDIHATAAYRAQLVRVLTERVVRSAAREGGR